MSIKKIAIIGLDCAPDTLLFDALRSEMPCLRSLMDNGLWGTLVSTDPPITIPAWTTITTGRDPGELGLYGFRNRLSYDRYDLTVVNSSHVIFPRVWDYLEREGAESFLLAIPQTYPPQAHRGITISGFPTPSFDKPFCHPAEMAEDVLRVAGGKYVNDIQDFRKKDKKLLVDELYSAAKARFDVARHFIRRRSWDFFMMVETTTDRLHHGLWADYDPRHPRHVEHNRFERVIPDFYRFLDRQIADLVGLMPDETTVMVVSDHGAGPMRGVVAINEWLIANGYLKLHCVPEQQAPLTPDMVDWQETKAWGEGGYYGRIFFNVSGREPCGKVSQADYDAFRDELADRLQCISDTQRGLMIRNTVLKPDELYWDCRNVPPDLMVYFDELNYRSSGLVGGGEVFPTSWGDGMDAANHKPNGVFVMARLSDVRGERQAGRQIDPISCMDIVPTVLRELRVPIPSDLRGKAAVLEPEMSVSSHSYATRAELPVLEGEFDKAGFTEEEEAIITQQLKDLGYM